MRCVAAIFVCFVSLVRAAQITIGSDSQLQSTTDQEYVANAQRLPASNSVQRLNPPIFQWPYYESMDLFTAATVTRVFNFQLTTNGSFASPLWSLTTSNIFYNFFPSITNADGSTWTGTVSWRIRYLNSNGSVAMGTSAVHTFTMPANAEKWDRSCFADKAPGGYLQSLSNLHPRILVKSTNIAAFRALVNDSGLPYYGKLFGATFNDLTNSYSLLAESRWTNANLTLQANWQSLPNALAKLGGAYWAVTNAWFTNGINAASPSIGSVLTNWCAETEAAGYDRFNAYEGNISGLVGLPLAYDMFYNQLTAQQRAVCLRLMENWAAFYIFEGWYYYGSDTNLDRVYGGRNLTMQYPSVALQDESHNRHDRAALMLCLGGMGDSPKLDYYAEWFLSYYISRFDPFQHFEDPRIYGGLSTISDWARAYHPWVLANTMFNDKKLTNSPVHNELADLYMFQTPIGHRTTGTEPWGPAESYQTMRTQNNYQYAGFGVHAIMTGRGDVLRVHKRAGGILYEQSDAWMIEFATSYWPLPTEIDLNTNSFIDPVRGWAVGLSTNATDYGAATNGAGFILQARPAGNGRSGGAMSDGNIEIFAYGANITAAGAGRYEMAALLMNGLFVDGVGVNNESPGIARPIHARFDAYTNWGGGVYVRADLTGAMNLSNYVAQGTANLQSYPGSSARVNYLQASNARPYISSVSRSVLFPHNKYVALYDSLSTTQAAQFQWKWNVFPTNCTLMDTGAMSFHYTVTNDYAGRSNVTVYVQHIGNPASMGVTQMVNSANLLGTNDNCYAKQNPFTGENYAGSNDWIAVGADMHDYYWANTVWVYNRTPTTNWHFLSVVYPVMEGDTAPTITRLSDNAVRVQHGSDDDVISFGDTNIVSPAITLFIDVPASTNDFSDPPIGEGGAPIVIARSRVRKFSTRGGKL